MRLLHSSIDIIHSSKDGREIESWRASLAFDAMVLLNVMAPMRFEISDDVILKAYSMAPISAVFHRARCLEQVQEIDREAIEEARRYWSRMGDIDDPNGFWANTVEFVKTVHDRATTLSNSIEQMQAFSVVLEKWVRSIWKLHSADGVSAPGAWSPLHSCPSPEAMTSFDVKGVFVDRERLEGNANRTRQRGAIFGLDYNALTQVLTTLNASHLPDTIVNHARNEGSICLRPSCNALKRDCHGNRPTAKSTSATYEDNNFEVSGEIHAREESARRQTAAWRKNNELIFRVSKFKHYKPGFSGSTRGSTISHDKFHTLQTDMNATLVVPPECKRAADAMLSASMEAWSAMH
jgi:hypothetical protein